MSAARTVALRVIQGLGATSLVRASRWRTRRLLILCYHGFSLADEHHWNPNLYVPGEHLAARLERLRRGGYVVLPLEAALERLYLGTLPQGAVSLTVDDGFYDFFATAYPLLREAGIPATVYASTYHVLDQRPIFDVACDYLLWKGRSGGRTSIAIDGLGERVELDGPNPAIAAKKLRALASSEDWSADRKHAALEHIARQLGIDWDDFVARRLLALMTPEEIGRLDPAIASVQLHTHRHRMPDDKDLFLREIAENREALIRCGRPAGELTHFCYPSGDYRPHHLPWLAQSGIRSATTCKTGLASRGSPALELPRFIDTLLTSELEFDAWAAGVRAFLRRPGWLRG